MFIAICEFLIEGKTAGKLEEQGCTHIKNICRQQTLQKLN